MRLRPLSPSAIRRGPQTTTVLPAVFCAGVACALAAYPVRQENGPILAVLPSLAPTARFGSLVTSAIALVVCSALPVEAADAVQQLIIRAELQPATALRVSSHVLVFDVGAEDGAAVAALDYVASARVPRDAELILSVQTMRGAGEPGGPAGAQGTLTIADGATLPPDTPVAVQRWIGGGTRSGTLVFRFQAARAGRYVVPVHVALLSP